MIIVETFIICDGNCGTNFGVDTRGYGRRKQVYDAKAAGWRVFKGKHYCPECRKKLTN